MRQPTFFFQAWPRFDHQVYCSGRSFSLRNTSTNPSSSNTRVSHARSSGRKPEFFWFERQFLRSTSLCAMFQVATDAVLVVDALTHDVLEANRAAGRLFA